MREETVLEIQVTRFLRMVSGFRLRLEVSFFGKLIGGTLRLWSRWDSEKFVLYSEQIVVVFELFL